MNIAEWKDFSIKYHGLVLQPHQVELIEFLEGGHDRQLVLMPRGHTKTTTVNQIWLSGTIAENPHLRILLLSHSKEMAESFSRTIRNVMDDPDLQHEFGLGKGSPWRANEWRLEQSPHSKPTLTTKGAMGRMAGWRGDLVIFDDLLEFTTTLSESIRFKIDTWIDQSVMPAINPHPLDRVIYVGTRKHIDDRYGQLLINPDYQSHTRKAFLNDEETLCLWPHLLDEDGNYVCDMWTIERLKKKRREIGALKFAQEYMNAPSPPEGLEFKLDWLRFYDHLPQKHLEYYMGIDPAGQSKSETSSYFAYVVVAYDPELHQIYIIDMYRGKLSKRQQVQKAFQVATKYKDMKRIFVEAVFEYTHVYDGLNALLPNVVPKDYVHTKLKGTSSIKKEARISEVVGPNCENGLLYFPRPSHHPFVKTFIDHEFLPFGSKGSDMDMLDALTLAIHHLVGEARITDVPWYFPD